MENAEHNGEQKGASIGLSGHAAIIQALTHELVLYNSWR
jgi:hypothetical protein